VLPLQGTTLTPGRSPVLWPPLRGPLSETFVALSAEQKNIGQSH